MTLLLTTLFLKSLLVFAAAGLLLLILRRSSAAARHLVCLLTLGAVLLLPLASISLPAWHLPALAARQAEPIPYQEPTPVRPSPPLPKREGQEFKQETYSVPAASASSSSFIGRTPAKQGGGFLPALYLLGLFLASARPLLGLWGIRRLSRACAEVEDAPTLQVHTGCVAALGLKHLPRLCRADVPVPMTWGWRQPVIVLPPASADWPEDRLRSVLLHEMAHVKRRDWAGHRLANFACAALWFHPLVWLLARRLRSESEIACADLVLASGIPAPDYARHLLAIAQTLPPVSRSPHSAIAMAQTSQIERRLHMILDKTRSRSTVARRALLAALIPSAAALLILAALRPDVKAQTPMPAPLPGQQQMNTLRLNNQQETLRIAQAQQIREHLTTWAQHNKATLLQMGQAQPNDLAALMTVYRSLEKQPLPLWDADPRLSKGNAMPAFSVQTTELTLTHLQHSKEPNCQRIRQDFAQDRDLRISRSVDPGNVCIVVWASGRITQSTVISKFIGYGKPFLHVESQKSITPGFFPAAGNKKAGEYIRYSITE